MKAVGYGTWWNQYGSQDLGLVIARARQTGFIITKWGFWTQFDAFRRAGLRIGIERYSYPTQPQAEAQMLAEGLRRGADFAVINAEIEWESTPAGTMRAFLAEFRRLAPTAELYASVDTRGGRTHLPFQRELAREITAWMPMIYPKAFAQSPAQAFRSSLESGQDFAGRPVLPTLQTYENIGPSEVSAQMAEVARRRLAGAQSYTVGHASGPEWQAYVLSIPAPPEEDEDMTWLDEKIVGFDGRPIRFKVLAGGPPSYPTQERELTRREHLTLDQLGILVDPGEEFANKVNELQQAYLNKHQANAGLHEPVGP